MRHSLVAIAVKNALSGIFFYQCDSTKVEIEEE